MEIPNRVDGVPMKVHCIDKSKIAGIKCEMIRARGPAVPPERASEVTCTVCLRRMAKEAAGAK